LLKGEETRERVFEKRVLRRIYAPKGGQQEAGKKTA
jgi:hypothetical protein